MRDGADVIYQAVFVDDDWRGVSDFLVRVDRPSPLGAWSYEAWDTKLARHPKPYFILQLCLYTEQLARMQGVDARSDARRARHAARRVAYRAGRLRRLLPLRARALPARARRARATTYPLSGRPLPRVWLRVACEERREPTII